MFTQSFSYNDIGLVPRVKSELSRSEEKGEIDTSYLFFDTELSLPIVAAPMQSVVDWRFTQDISKLGGLAFLPRSCDTPPNGDLVLSIPAVHHNILQLIHNAVNTQGVTKFCIDVANGFHSIVEKVIKDIRQCFADEVYIIAGNVASWEGYKALTEWGADAIRVGIGGGSVCTTSIATGVGVGQASVVRDIAAWRKEGLLEYRDGKIPGTGGIGKFPPDEPRRGWPLIIADGGIKTPGDVCKAISLGADLVMAGRIFAGCEEAAGEVIKAAGFRKYKVLAGQASMKIKGERTYIEGDDQLVPYTGPLEETWTAFKHGLRSAMAYMNAPNLDSLRYLNDDCFTLLSQGARHERGVHILEQ